MSFQFAYTIWPTLSGLGTGGVMTGRYSICPKLFRKLADRYCNCPLATVIAGKNGGFGSVVTSGMPRAAPGTGWPGGYGVMASGLAVIGMSWRTWTGVLYPCPDARLTPPWKFGA